MLFGKSTRSEEEKMQRPSQDDVECVVGTETEVDFSLSAFEDRLRNLDAQMKALKDERATLTERVTLLATAAGVTALKLRGDDPELDKRKAVQRLRAVEGAISGVRSEINSCFSRTRKALDAAKGRIWARLYSEIVAPYEAQLSNVLKLEADEAIFVLSKLKPATVSPERSSEIKAFESVVKAFNEAARQHGASHSLVIPDDNLPQQQLERTLEERLMKLKHAVIPPVDKSEQFAGMFREVAAKYKLPVGQVAVDPVKL